LDSRRVGCWWDFLRSPCLPPTHKSEGAHAGSMMNGAERPPSRDPLLGDVGPPAVLRLARGDAVLENVNRDQCGRSSSGKHPPHDHCRPVAVLPPHCPCILPDPGAFPDLHPGSVHPGTWRSCGSPPITAPTPMSQPPPDDCLASTPVPDSIRNLVGPAVTPGPRRHMARS